MTRAQLKFPANTSSAIPLIALGAVAVAAGYRYHSAGGMALGAVLVTAPLLLRIALRHAVRRMVVRRHSPDTVYEGDSVRICIHLENRSSLPLFFPQVSEIFTPEIHAQKDVLFPDRVAPGEIVERSYDGVCLLPRGVYSIGPTAIAVSDPFGWFQIRKELKGLRKLKVYPQVHDIAVKEKLGDCISHVVDELTRPSIGESSEFFGVREYRSGDALRRVHWGLTAHRGFPVVREFARTSTGDLNLFLDSYRLALTGVGRSSSTEYAVKIAASFAAKALGRGHRVRLVAGDDDDLHVPLGAGSMHFQRILDVLVDIKPTGTRPLTELLEQNARSVIPGATVVVMLSRYVFRDQRLESMLGAWSRRGVRVVAILFDARTFQSVWGRSEEIGADLDSERCLRRLEARGIECHLLSCGANLPTVFARTR